MKRRPRKPPREHGDRLVKILQQNLATATSPELRERLRRAIEALKAKAAAA
jgi:hypothetical protein